LAPWQSLRQRLMRAWARRPFLVCRYGSGFSLCWSSARSLSRATDSIATLPSALVVHFGVLDTRGAAISETVCVVSIAGTRRPAPPPAVTLPRRFCISRRFPFFPIPNTLPWSVPLSSNLTQPPSPWPALSLLPSGCTADRILPHSPTGDAAPPPACAPQPRSHA